MKHQGKRSLLFEENSTYSKKKPKIYLARDP
jgi:hypothetical protein